MTVPDTPIDLWSSISHDHSGAVLRVLNLHTKRTVHNPDLSTSDYCAECRQTFPCATVRAVQSLPP